MLLSAKILGNCVGVNDFVPTSTQQMMQGDPVTVTIQLFDVSINRRYVPASAATLQVTINPIDVVQQVVRTATQPFAGDGSIWQFQILSTDPLMGTQDLVLSLTEGAVVRSGIVKQGLSITPLNQSFNGIGGYSGGY